MEVILPMKRHTLENLLEKIVWIQERNHRAYLSHRKRRLRNLIKDLGKETTVLMSTHILQEAQSTCERILIINNGLLVADDTPEQLARGDENPLTRRQLRQCLQHVGIDGTCRA